MIKIENQWVFPKNFLPPWSHGYLPTFPVYVFQHEKTALHLAAEEGHLDAVMRLIDLRADVNRRDTVTTFKCLLDIRVSGQ